MVSTNIELGCKDLTVMAKCTLLNDKVFIIENVEQATKHK